MKVGDWVLTESDEVGQVVGFGRGDFDWLCKIEIPNEDTYFKTCRQEIFVAKTLTKIDPALYPILSDSTKEET